MNTSSGDLNRFSSVVNAANYYHSLGWEPVPIPHKEKSPKHKWGQVQVWDEASLSQAFNGKTNIGIALGDRSSGIVDIDFDSPEAVRLAKLLLPDLPSFGRSGSRSSHRIAFCTTKKKR